MSKVTRAMIQQNVVERWLWKYLNDGPGGTRKYQEVVDMADVAGHSWNSVQRAKRSLFVRSIWESVDGKVTVTHWAINKNVAEPKELVEEVGIKRRVIRMRPRDEVVAEREAQTEVRNAENKEARMFLRNVLLERPLETSDVRRVAEETGVDWRAVMRMRDSVGVIVSGNEWALPNSLRREVVFQTTRELELKYEVAVEKARELKRRLYALQKIKESLLDPEEI